MRKTKKSSFRSLCLLLSGAFVSTLLVVGPAHADELPDTDLAPETSLSAGEASFPLESRETDLGQGWRESDDVATTGFGSSSGYHIAQARESGGYEWQTIATLGWMAESVDRWVGNMCVSADGEFAIAVYGPRSLENDEFSFRNGASAALVELSSGKVIDLGVGYSLAYFNPGCGAGNTVALSRFDDGVTHVVVIDVLKADVSWKTSIEGQVTSLVPAGTGFVGADGAGVTHYTPEGEKHVAPTAGVPYALAVDQADIVTFAETDGTVAKIYQVALDGSAKPQLVATGPVQETSVVRSDSGAVYVTGAEVKDGLSEVQTTSANPSDAISSRSGLIVGPPYAPTVPGTVDVPNAIARVQTDQGSSLDLSIPLDASGLRFSDSRSGASAARSSGTTPTDPARTCGVARNDPGIQVLQPKPRQVEWAANRAVEGNLSIVRPANWNNSGLASYVPQDVFPLPSLSGGGQVPVQILLGIAAQESNLWQASRYASPGQTGNPLVGLFYGNDRYAGFEDVEFWTIDFPEADCGYGVGQITDGMRVGGPLTYTHQKIIAVDYAANIAKSLQMIAQKWNATRTAGLIVNDGDPMHPENWFFALWAYNTGFYPEGAPGEPWGVGWFNNPGNPEYPPSRGSFLDGSPWDAANPQDWPYPEKVLGFAAHSLDLVERVTPIAGQPTYDYVLVSAFRTAWWAGGSGIAEARRSAVKPPLYLFCDITVNECDESDPDVCTRLDSRCWWNEPATWKNCLLSGTPNNECGYEFVRFEPAYDYMDEQANGDSMPPNCGNTGLPAGSLVIDNSSLDVGGTVTSYPPALAAVPTTSPPTKATCNPVASDGSFSLDFGAADTNGNYPSKIDFHQLGGGLNSHFYFTHTWSTASGVASSVTGTWTLDQPLTGWARVLVHLPDHAAWAQGAEYLIDTGSGSASRVIMQHRFANGWVPLGVFEFDGTPSISLSNVEPAIGEWSGPGSLEGIPDIAWDAVAFQPLASKPADFVVALGDSFSSGEGVGTASGSMYYLETNSDGGEPTANACHRSTGAWSRKATLPGESTSSGTQADTLDSSMDFHFLACSGAEVYNLLPTGVSDGGRLAAPQGMVPPQLDQGYLDENTTLVTFSIGGNDIGFASVVRTCILDIGCEYLEADVLDRIDTLRDSLRILLEEIHDRAPNAVIYAAGYPNLFETGGSCIFVGAADWPWLRNASLELNTAIEETLDDFATDTGATVAFGDPTLEFAGKNLCETPSAINGVVLTLTDGEGPQLPWFTDLGASQESVHPNYLGTDLYAEVMEDALIGVYP